MNAWGKHDVQHGRLRYSLYDTEQEVELSMDNPIVVSADSVPKLQFLLIDGDIYYNHWDAGLGAFETVNHPLTQHTTPPSTMYQPEYIQATSTQALVLNQDIGAFTQEAAYGSSVQLVGNSIFRLQPGVYNITLSAGIDFTNANGNIHIVAMNHATHTSLLNPTLRAQLEASPSVNVDDVSQGINTFIGTFNAQTDICVRPTLIAHYTSTIFVSVIIQRLS